MKIVFIRHLKTPGNEKRQYIGRTDEDLSEQAVEEFKLRQEKSIGALYPTVQAYHRKPAEAVHSDSRTYLSGTRDKYRTDDTGVRFREIRAEDL